ncbi:MAG: hypothetical protein KC418_13965 [Anaerolineales bacterium]|nr:hypothetical protein [Anaerolineales bacterium]MCB8952144.1 hypothetical protein [Ardenticatenales bacterium]
MTSKSRKTGAIALVLLSVGLMFTFTRLALAGRPLNTEDFAPASEQGFGDHANGWAWSMQWWNGYLYVGTNHDWRCGEVLAQARNSFGIIPYPDDDPDVNCPDDPLDLDMRAEIWRWEPQTDTWERVFQAPYQVFTEFTQLGGSISNPVTVTVDISPTNVARDIGYRGMTLFTDPDGTEALYVTAVSPSYLGYRVPPRILRSVDGVNFEPIPADPGTPLGGIQKTSLRNPTIHVGTDGITRLYVQAGSSKGSGAVFESANPGAGNNYWRKISPADMKFSHMASYNGALYMGVRDPNSGFGVIRMYTDGGPLPYDFDYVLKNGGDSPTDQPNVEVLSMMEFKGRLFVGGNGIIVGFIPSLNAAAEVFRINPDSSWDLIAGEPRVGLPFGAPDKLPLSGYGGGFDNPNNGHMWRMAVEDEHLYLTTFDGSIAGKDEPEIPQDVLDAMGFDLWRTSDGAHFTPVTTNGFSALIDDPNPPRPDLNLGAFDSGGRNMENTPYGFFLGTANYYYGLRIFRAFLETPPNDVSITGDSTAVVDTTFVYTATTVPITTTLTQPLTYVWEASDQAVLSQEAELQNTATFSWTNAGIKTITVTVNNQYGSATNSFNVNVLDDEPGFIAESAIVKGPSLGTPGTTYQFQVDVGPLNAAQPIQYTWQATGQENQIHTNGARDFASFTWNSSGEKAILVIVDNGFGSPAIGTFFVNISSCVPMNNIRMPMMADTQLFPGSVATFQGHAFGGTPPFHYEWRVDGEHAGINDSRLIQPFPDAGIHTIDLTISNACSEKSVSRSVLVGEPYSPRADLSLSRVIASRSQVDNGDTIDYTIQIWNTNDTTATLRLASPIPSFTEYVPDSVRSSDEGGATISDENVILWKGDISSGTPVLVSFSVTVTDEITRVGTPIVNETFLQDVDTGNEAALETTVRYQPGYALNINGPLFLKDTSVTLNYDWDEADNITHVRFSDHAGFGSETSAHTTGWIEVSDTHTYAPWFFDLSNDLRMPRIVYAMFRDAEGNVKRVLATTYKVYDPAPPEVTAAEIIPDSPYSQLVHLRITAVDDVSGVRSILVGHDAALTDAQRFDFAGPTDDIPWTLQPSGEVYFRAQDRAGRYSNPVTALQGDEAVPLDSVDIVIGPSIGYVGKAYNFFISSGPFNVTHPITYTWQATEQSEAVHVSDQSDLIQYTWTTPGTKIITFTAENVLTSAVNTHTIVIEEAPPTPTPTNTPPPTPTGTPMPTPSATPPPITEHELFLPVFMGSGTAQTQQPVQGGAFLEEPPTWHWTLSNQPGISPWLTLLLLLMPASIYLFANKGHTVTPERQITLENQPQKFSDTSRAAI